MKVELQRSYAVPAPAAAAWSLLQDIEAVAQCMPGAQIAERVDERHYKGSVTVKVGPAKLSFKGTIEVADLDVPARALRLLGKGTDTTGGSGASLDLSARIEPDGDAASRLAGSSVVSISGKAASFGARMMNPLAEQVLRQFADNFAQRAAQLAAQPAAREAAQAGDPAARDGAAAPSTTPTAASPAAAPELNGLALLWSVLRNWLRGLFGANKA